MRNWRKSVIRIMHIGMCRVFDDVLTMGTDNLTISIISSNNHDLLNVVKYLHEKCQEEILLLHVVPEKAQTDQLYLPFQPEFFACYSSYSLRTSMVNLVSCVVAQWQSRTTSPSPLHGILDPPELGIIHLYDDWNSGFTAGYPGLEPHAWICVPKLQFWVTQLNFWTVALGPGIQQ